MIREMLEQLALPEKKSREEMLSILQREEYGNPPPTPQKVWAETLKEEREFAGKGTVKTMQLHFELQKGEGSFPFLWIVPNGVKDPLTVVYISFEPQIPSKYFPTEELLDEGIAVAHLYYEDVACDRDDGFAEAIPQLLGYDGTDSCFGKVSLWAWAASRVADGLLTTGEVTSERLAVAGHSRLGKTALLAAAQDERFRYVLSNDSGCSGAALSRNNTGETVDAICRQFPFWFCRKYASYAGREKEMPFDQHYLLACIEPRYVYVTSAEEDSWACPVNEYLSCCAAGGLVHPNRLPKAGDRFAQGRVGYHIRSGSHFLSREDWIGFVRFLKEK